MVEVGHMKLWALEQAVAKGKTKPTAKVLEEAAQFYSFISGQPKAQIMEIKMGCKKKSGCGKKK